MFQSKPFLQEYTAYSTGLQCWFDSNAYDCAQCLTGGCGCATAKRHWCVVCGNNDDCNLLP